MYLSNLEAEDWWRQVTMCRPGRNSSPVESPSLEATNLAKRAITILYEIIFICHVAVYGSCVVYRYKSGVFLVAAPEVQSIWWLRWVLGGCQGVWPATRTTELWRNTGEETEGTYNCSSVLIAHVPKRNWKFYQFYNFCSGNWRSKVWARRWEVQGYRGYGQ